jgi:hypothetical protein
MSQNPCATALRGRPALSPSKPQLVQVIEADIALVHAFDEMVTNGGGEP